MRTEKGFALVITLIVTALLVAVVIEFVHEIYVETSLHRSYADAQQASLLADSGVNGGIKLLQTVLAGQSFSSLQDRWAAPLEIEDEKGSLRVDIVEENGKLNLNALVYPNGTETDFYGMASRLAKALDTPAEFFVAVADWSDDYDEPRPDGAESSYYQGLSTPYRAKNGVLDTLDELRLIKGYDLKVMKALMPFVTVYGNAAEAQASKININTAPPEVLAALDEGMDKTLVTRIVEHRKVTPFASPAEITSIPGLEGIGTGLQGKIGVQGTHYRIYSQARVKETIRIIEALVKIEGSNSAILYWREL